MASHSRYASTHASSSAFSASANPNEDWTKISDLAERRRIQNRIAQRNYRKKLKRRLEDLERRAGSSSASPEQQPSELASTKDVSSRHSHSMTRQSSQHSATQEVQHLSPELLPLDEHSPLFEPSRHLPISSPPALTYSTYPPTHSYLQHEYSNQPSYQTSQQNYFFEYQYPTDYSQSLPPTLPTMLPSTYATKQDALYGEDDMMNPFAMNYASLAGLDVPTAQHIPSPHSHSHVNPTYFLPRSYSHPPPQPSNAFMQTALAMRSSSSESLTLAQHGKPPRLGSTMLTSLR